MQICVGKATVERALETGPRKARYVSADGDRVKCRSICRGNGPNVCRRLHASLELEGRNARVDHGPQVIDHTVVMRAERAFAIRRL